MVRVLCLDGRGGGWRWRIGRDGGTTESAEVAEVRQRVRAEAAGVIPTEQTS
jgi:hypothetical protein